MNKRNIILIVVAFFGVIGLLFLSIQFNNSRNDIDQVREGGDDTNVVNQVTITDGDELYELVEGRLRYEAVSEDLYYFGKAGYAKYDDNSAMNFKVEKVEKNDTTVTITGIYGATKNEIVADFKLLKNGKVAASITDTTTQLNIDVWLPSNTKRNQFIATLPLDNNRFGVDYVDQKEIYSVTLYTDEANAEQEAINYIKEQTSDTYIDPVNIRIIVPSWVQGGIEE